MTRPPLFTVALTSGLALALEVLLMRLLSIVQWHHFAYLVISLALLGYGVSGTFLAVTQHRLARRYTAVLLANVALFPVTAVACFHIAQRIPFNAEEVLWDPWQLLYLAAVYLLLTLPFFVAANVTALTLMHHRDQMPRIYAYNLAGAGAGSVVVVGLMFLLPPLATLKVLAALGLAAVVAAVWELAAAGRRWVAVAALAGLVVLAWAPIAQRLAVSPYKGLSQTLRIPGTRIADERSSPLGYLSVVESPQVPLRHAPGLSIRAVKGPTAQTAIFTDADNPTFINLDATGLKYLDYLTSALPYHLRPLRRVLILGAGGGADIQQARLHGVGRITAVELNPDVVDIVQSRAPVYSGPPGSPAVDVHVGEARGFVAGAAERYDLIQLALLDSFAASSAGLYALNESYLYTVEALKTYLARLEPDGYLSLTRWVKLPPRDTLKLFATAVAALTDAGLVDPGRRLMMIRSWQTSTLLIKNGEVTPGEIAAMRRFTEPRAFDLVWHPGLQRSEANRFNVLSRPFFHEAAVALLGPRRDQFLERYKYDIRPSTDDRPYFFHFHKWGVMAEILSLRGRGGTPLVELGYLVLAATLLKAVIASAGLILLPLWILRRRRRVESSAPLPALRVFGYFFAIGLAFLFVEIAFIQKFLLFLQHPLYAITVTLTAFLVFAGLGSATAHHRMSVRTPQWIAGAAVAGICVVAGLYLWLLGPLFDLLLAQPIPVKIGVAVLLIAPLAFGMGMPFPVGLLQLGEDAPQLVPWAWGVNGCASVISAVLATLLAIHFGFTAVVLAAMLLYLLAWLSFPLPAAVPTADR